MLETNLEQSLVHDDSDGKKCPIPAVRNSRRGRLSWWEAAGTPLSLSPRKRGANWRRTVAQGRSYFRGGSIVCMPLIDHYGPTSRNRYKKLIAELRDQLEQANVIIFRLNQLLKAQSGNFYKGIKLTRTQRRSMIYFWPRTVFAPKKVCTRRFTIRGKVTNRSQRLSVKRFVSCESN
jgi:hypothetical protein